MTRAVLVKSCQRYRDRRKACADTWAGELAKHVPLYFVEGGHYRRECVDGVIRLTGRDDYDANSIKVREAIRFMLETVAFDTLFICDDNTFVDTARWLAHEPGGEFEGLATEKIPWVHGGAGWWMSRRCCQLYVDGVKRICSWDDKLATEILSGVPFINRPDLYAQWDERIGDDNTLITCHNVDPDEMRALYAMPVVHDLLRRT